MLGDTPLNCEDVACISTTGSGVCGVWTQSGKFKSFHKKHTLNNLTGLAICACCAQAPDGGVVACEACGGDDGTSRCRGTGSGFKSFRGCQCSNSNGNVPATPQLPQGRPQCPVANIACDSQACTWAPHPRGVCFAPNNGDRPPYQASRTDALTPCSHLSLLPSRRVPACM